MANAGWFVNGDSKTMEDSIKAMKRFNAKYMREMHTLSQAEGIFTRFDPNTMSIPELKQQVYKSIQHRIDPAHAGKLPILCKDGRTRYYNPESWSETMARTRSRGLQEEGLHNEMKSVGFDLVIVSRGGSGDECRFWEGKILSISGTTPGYQTTREAQSIHLFHPRCVHSTSPIIATQDEETEEVVIWGRDITEKAMRKLIVPKGFFPPDARAVFARIAEEEIAEKVAVVAKKTVSGAGHIDDLMKRYKDVDPNDFREVVKVGDAVVKEAAARVSAAGGTITNERIRNEVSRVLKEKRQFGGPLKVKIKSNATREIYLKAATDEFPTDWINTLSKANYRYDMVPADRSFLVRLEKGKSTIGLSRKTNVADLVHEFGHVFEVDYSKVGNSKLQILMGKWRESRVGLEKPKWLGGGFGETEIGWRDKFADKYIGKYYSQNRTEVFSMGMESFARGKGVAWGVDPEMDSLIIGALLLL